MEMNVSPPVRIKWSEEMTEKEAALVGGQKLRLLIGGGKA